MRVAVPMVSASRVDAKLIPYHLPEFNTDLTASLAGLQVHNLPHGSSGGKCEKTKQEPRSGAQNAPHPWFLITRDQQHPELICDN